MLSRYLINRAILLQNIKNVPRNLNQVRNASGGQWAYRVPPQMPSKRAILQAEIIGGICWWWILYHIATEPEHIYGEWPYVDPSTWSNEELGIPEDSAGPLKRV